MPVDALTKKVAWSDFQKVDKAAPKEGESVHAAHTAVAFSLTLLGVTPDLKANPQTFRVIDSVITVKMLKGSAAKESWVAKFVFKRSQADQDALLHHEEGHYLLSALYARDYSNAIKAAGKTAYSNKADAEAALKAITDDFSPASPKTSPLEKIHTAYDDQVTDLFANSTEQTKWDKAIASAKSSSTTTLRAALTSAGLI